jgi:hypothetical protein
MPRIVAYHPEIFVRRRGEVVAIKMDLPDWASDEEILNMLVDETRGRTMGQVVERIEKNRNTRARIEKVEKARVGRLAGEGRKIYDAGDLV